MSTTIHPAADLVPLEWIRVQGGGRISDLAAIDFYRALRDGRDLTATDYGRTIAASRANLHADPLAWFDRLRSLQAKPYVVTPLPAHIDARGRYTLTDGHHRAARCIEAGLLEIPIEIASTSPLWDLMLANIQGIYPGRRHWLYQEIEHPFFQRPPWAVDRSPGRLDLIRAALERAGARPSEGFHLDIGSCTGRICRDFARRGWISYGIDIDPVVIAIAEHLSSVFDVFPVYYRQSNTLELLTAGFASVGAGVITCLSVFHRALAAGRVAWVQRLYRRCMEAARLFLVDNASPGDASVQTGAFNEWAPERFQTWLASIAPAGTTIEPIGATEDRTIFLATQRP